MLDNCLFADAGRLLSACTGARQQIRGTEDVYKRPVLVWRQKISQPDHHNTEVGGSSSPIITFKFNMLNYIVISKLFPETHWGHSFFKISLLPGTRFNRMVTPTSSWWDIRHCCWRLMIQVIWLLIADWSLQFQ